jgi:signal peptidase I
VSWFAQRSTGRNLQVRQQEELEAKGLMAEIWDWLKSTVAALIVVLLIHQFGFNLSTVKGHSMEPTLQEGEWLFVNKAMTYFGTPKRGDIVILKEPDQVADSAHPYLVKRVVAIAGDKVEISSGRLFVNGVRVEEPYTDSVIQDGDYGPREVEKGHVFVMGDNRRLYASEDSRSFGTVPLKLIQGRAEYILWPFSLAGKL